MRSTGMNDEHATPLAKICAAARLAVSGRAASLAVAGLALTMPLLAMASPAGAASLPGGTHQRLAAGIEPNLSPVAWNGTDVVTTQVGANGTLYAYEQVPGTSSWRRQTVETLARNGEVPLGAPSITATATSVQIVSEDADGNIWFYQQADGQTSWSAPHLVGTVSVVAPGGIQAPQIAWTGVPGHTGTNSVITITDAAGDVLFFYQAGAGWNQETVASATGTNAYYAPAVTATDTGVVIVASGTNGAFFSFFQPYGGPTWDSDGSVSVSTGQVYADPSVTWDGVNVDVTAAFGDGSGAYTPVLLWKSDTAEFWSKQSLPGVTDAQPLAVFPSIAYTGDNLIVTAVQTGSSKLKLDFWWQGSTFTTFHQEKVATAGNSSAFGPPALVSTHEPASNGEVVITAPFTTNGFTTSGLDDWTQPVGASGWVKHTVTSP
jgi:hypothetical protein